MQQRMAAVSTVYMQVVDDVISNVRQEFQAADIDETVLLELQQLWELKMFQSGAIPGSLFESRGMYRQPNGPVGPVVTPVQDLNMPYQGTEEDEGAQFSNRAYEAPAYQYLPTVASDNPDAARPTAFMAQPNPWMHHPQQQQRPHGVDINVAYDESRNGGLNGQEYTGKRKREQLTSAFVPHIPQHDGASDSSFLFQKVSTIPQRDGVDDDDYNDEVAAEDYNAPGEEEAAATNNTTAASSANATAITTIAATSTATATASTPAIGGADEGGDPSDSENSEPPLNEDDDEEDDVAQEDDQFRTENLVLCQFEKVSRTKSKWKCVLKDGLMHLNNHDILFSKANGEFDF